MSEREREQEAKVAEPEVESSNVQDTESGLLTEEGESLTTEDGKRITQE